MLPPGPLSGAVSGSVTFSTALRPPERPFLFVSWTFKGTNVITSSANEDLPGEGYADRISLDRTTGSLQLRRLTAADSGEYVVTVIPEGESQKQGKIVLNVYGGLDVNLTVPMLCSCPGYDIFFLKNYFTIFFSLKKIFFFTIFFSLKKYRNTVL